MSSILTLARVPGNVRCALGEIYCLLELNWGNMGQRTNNERESTNNEKSIHNKRTSKNEKHDQK
jgi:hypothetical protein